MMRSAFTILGLLFVLALPSARATGPVPLHRLEATEEAMGAGFSLILHGPDADALDQAAAAAFAEAHRLDAMLSNYKPASEWSEVNRAAARGPVKVSEELFALLSSCQEYSTQSDGAFDISVGALVRVWGFYKGEGALPRPEQVSGALERVGYAKVRLDPAARTVRFTTPGVELDPGGIGKGYAVDRMVEVLRAHGVTAALVSAAGSSIYGLGAPPEDARGWPITIRAPRGLDSSAAELLLRDGSVSTSGGYEKFFWAEGRSYSHLIDPRTGYPAQGTASVSVLAPRATDSEAWTKPAFINGPQWTAARKPKGMRVFYCADDRSTRCFWL